MFAYQLPALREWPVPGRKIVAAVRALWAGSKDIHAWHDERERQAFLQGLEDRRRSPPFAGNLRMF